MGLLNPLHLGQVKFILLLVVVAVAIVAFTDTRGGHLLRKLAIRVFEHPRIRSAIEHCKRMLLEALPHPTAPEPGADVSGHSAKTFSSFPLREGDRVATVESVESDGTLSLRSVTSFEAIGHAALSEIVEEYGGDAHKLVRHAVVRNRKTGEALRFDSMYSDRGQSFAFDFQGLKSALYPNPFHFSERDFEAQRAFDARKALAAARAGIVLVTVPYVIDRCERDSREVSGWRHEPALTAQDRKRRIKRYLHAQVLKYQTVPWSAACA